MLNLIQDANQLTLVELDLNIAKIEKNFFLAINNLQYYYLIKENLSGI